MSQAHFKAVHQPAPKIDAMAIATGKPVYTDDLAPENCLIVKLLRSPHAFARILSIDKAAAEKVPGVICVLTYADMPRNRYTFAGQSYPETSPYDRYILEDLVRYVGDAVAIVAAETQDAADRALKLIRVTYEKLEPVLDFEKARGSASVVHPEEDIFVPAGFGADRSQNLVSADEFLYGDPEKEFAACDLVLEETYYTKANAQSMMETFRTFTYLDHNGRLVVVDSTQVPFHVRRIMARALGLPKSKIRVIKPRIGGGFGAKQTLVSEMFPAIVTLKTGRPAKIIFTRKEAFSASNSRHEMRLTVKLGAMKDGTVRAIALHTLENAGAYAEHAWAVSGLSGHKSLPLYGKAAAYRFTTEVVYTNTMAGGAFRGFGATQGCFAVESTVNKMADLLGLDPVQVRLLNRPAVGQPMPAYYNETLNSCALDRCIETGKKMIGWSEKFPAKKIDEHTYRGVGMAVTMQGSGISGIDNGAATLRLNDDNFYTLMIGATDMGTGCDTILAQMAAEVLLCPVSRITVDGVDTDHSPYDTGSYASASTYITGNAVVRAAEALVKKMQAGAAALLNVPADELAFDGDSFFCEAGRVTLEALAQQSVVGSGQWLTATESFGSPVSPPPFVAGFAEVEVDTDTGEVKLLDFVGVVDCGTVVNPILARVQAEGGLAQGIGMALYEDITYTPAGRMRNDTFMQYKIPSRLDLPDIRVAFEESYEPTGPFGAKSIGEVVINTPCPAIQSAISHAVGVRVHSLPITAEKVLLALSQKKADV